MAKVTVRVVVIPLVAASIMASTSQALTPFADDPLHWPDSTTTIRRSIAAAIESKDPKATEAQATRLAEVGGSLSPASQATVAELIGEIAMTPIRTAYAENTKPIEASTVETQIPASFMLVEGLAIDPKSARLYFGTVVSRKLAFRDGGNFKIIDTGPDTGSLFGMAIDTPRRLLWLASGVAAVTPAPAGVFSGLIAVNLDTQSAVKRVAAPASMKGALGDVVVATDGTVYASNGETGEVFRCPPGCDELSPVVPAGRFRSAQGMAFSPDKSRLLVADYGNGIAAVDLATGKIDVVAPLSGIPIDGTDGLAIDGNRLLLIQNGLRPFRITELKVSDDGRRILGARVRERSNPSWGEPTLGVLAGNALIYVSNAGWENYGDGGIYKGAEPRSPTTIRRVEVVQE